MNETFSILLIDDNEIIVEGFEEKIKFLNKGYVFKKYIYNTKISEDIIVDEISKAIISNKITHIISNRNFSQISITRDKVIARNSNKIIDPIILRVIDRLDESILGNLRALIIYAHDPVSVSIRKEFKELRQKISSTILKNRPASKTKVEYGIKIIETSKIFRRPGKTNLYPNGLNKSKCEVGSMETCAFYGEFIADFLQDIIYQDEQLGNTFSNYSYYKPENYAVQKFISSIEGPKISTNFRIGSLSCYGKVYGEAENLVNFPFRNDFENIKDYVDKNALNDIFYEDGNKTIDSGIPQWVCYKYEVYKDEKLYILQCDVNNDTTNVRKTYKQWLPLLHAIIFYCKKNNWKTSLLESKPRKENPISVITVFFAISEIKESNFIGSFNFTLFSENNDKNLNEIEYLAFEYYSHLLESKLFEQILPYKNKEIQRQAAKAAISQVMSRNLSHNLGSHVLANLTSPEALLEMAENNDHDGLPDLEKRLSYTIAKSAKHIYVNSKATSFNVAVAELNRYLRTRMDFLADISTGTSVIETTKNILKDVTDPLNKGNYFLRKYISGNKKEVEINNPTVERLNAAFPNDNLGVQAFYVIVENVVRNSAKHGKGKNKVSICWKVDEKSHNDLVELIIYDVQDVIEEMQLGELIRNQQTRIDLPILSGDVLRKNSWGMLEMKIAASYLRKVPIEKIDEKQKISLLTAVSVTGLKGKYLGYKFYLLKPKNVLVVLNKMPEDFEEIKSIESDFVTQGIEFIFLNKLNNDEKIFNHEIVVLVDIGNSLLKENRKRFSKRIVACNHYALKQKVVKNRERDFIEWAWSLWQDKIITDTNSIKIEFVEDGDGESNSKIIDINKDSVTSIRNAILVNHCKTFREESEYFESCGSLHPASNWINDLTNENEENYFEVRSRFSEMINYSVAIVDERIQSHSQISYDGGMVNCNKKLGDFLKKCGIFVPNEQIDLNAELFNNELNKKLIDWIESRSKDNTFIVIHLGIIEKLCGFENKSDEKKRVEIDILLSRLQGIAGRKATYIITSGRGQPDTLPKGERFVHYSNIAQYVIEKQSKFHLIQLLMSARETQ